jgi:hypothetical protein
MFNQVYAPHTEKQRRIYYQSIVYDVCNLLDILDRKSPGQGLVCGTVEHPSTEVQERVAKLCAERMGLNA